MTTAPTYAEIKTLHPLETTCCSRCGGSGSYSFCTAHGTRCFKCGGKKRILTKRAAIARDYITSLRVDTKPASELALGDVVKYDSFYTNQRGWAEVIKVESSLLNAGHISYEVKGVRMSQGLHGTTSVEVLHERYADSDTWLQGIALQASLTKMGKPTKTTPPEALAWLQARVK
jgi:hypothetical protein